MDAIPVLTKLSIENNIIIFGCGKNGKMVFEYLKKTRKNERVVCFADNGKSRHVRHYKKKEVICPESARKLYKNAVWILSSPKNLQQMSQQLGKMHINNENIIQITEDDIRTIYKYIHKYWYDEDKCFMYDYGFPINTKFLTSQIKYRLQGIKYDCYLKKDISLQKKNKKYKYNVSICAIFLNEAPYIREWIEFHKIVGIEHFYLYNNMSTDKYEQILFPYVKEGEVTLEDWNIPHGQVSAYWDCIRKFSNESRWIGFIDLDEFVVPHKKKIYDFLRPYNHRYGSVLIYWKTYGSSGRDNRNLEDLVIEDFTKCWEKLEDIGKCFYNTSYPLSSVKKNGQGFYHVCWTQKDGKDLPPVNIYGKVSVPGSIQRGRKGEIPIQINHYLTKSYREYQKKIVQPDATFEVNPRSDDVFSYYDKKAVATDNVISQYLPELKNKLSKRNTDVIVSIIIPIYNAEKYLVQCIESVVNQTLKNIEILCIDDGSTDASLKILKEYESNDPRIKVYSKKNSGYGHTINYGLQKSHGKYIAIVESDDFIDSDGIEELYFCAEENEAEYVRANYYEFRNGQDHMNMTLNIYPYNKVLTAFKEPQLFYTMEVSPWACLYKREFLNKYHIRMNETPGAAFQDNSWQFIVLLMANRVVLLEKPFYHYRTDNSNSSINSSGKAFCVVDEKNYMEKKLKEYQISDPDIYAAFVRFIYVIYKWNYCRIAGELQKAFLLEWKKEIVRQTEKGFLKKEIFEKGQWDEINCIVEKTDEYFRQTAKLK